ncbi:MAG TPA: hypothetical protein DHU96_03725 [Actinobacteria bacterium]|nr:hypothetical protein [Actinomycetota bacterium]
MPPTAASLDVVTFGEAMGPLVTGPPRPLRSAGSFARPVCGAGLQSEVEAALAGADAVDR